MDCNHFLPAMPLSDSLRAGLSISRADACALLLPSNPKHEEHRATLQAEGLKPVPVFACPFAAGGRWKACPYFSKPARRTHRRR